jgi:hypothetical protein
MNLTDSIALVENALRDLIREWERFFAGDLKVPPQAKHDRISGRLKSLSHQPMQRRADQFRLEQLEHRFMAYAMNWERMLREREEGRGRFAPGAQAKAAGAASPTNTARAESVDQRKGDSLYDRYVAAKSEHGQEVGADRAAFEAQIDAERAKLEDRLGEKVRFEVLVEDGKVKLAARRERRKGEGK